MQGLENTGKAGKKKLEAGSEVMQSKPQYLKQNDRKNTRRQMIIENLVDVKKTNSKTTRKRSKKKGIEKCAAQ